jgi:hypothetical protein
MAKKPGKYSHVIGKLAVLPPEAGEYQDKVEAAKEAILAEHTIEDEVLPIGREGVEHYLKTIDEKFERLHDALARATATRCRERAPAAADFAASYVLLRQVKDRLEAIESNTNLLLEAYTQLMAKAMDDEGASSIRLTTGENISTYLEPYARVSDQEAFRQWCVKQGFERKMLLHPSTTASLAKDMLAKGDDLPPGIEVWAKPRFRMGS